MLRTAPVVLLVAVVGLPVAVAANPDEATLRARLADHDDGAAADPWLLRTLSELGTRLVVREKSGEARAMLERARRIQRRVLPENDLLAAEILHGLARVEILDDRPYHAAVALAEASSLVEPFVDERPELVARQLRQIDVVLGRRRPLTMITRRPDRERELYEQALSQGRLSPPPWLEQPLRDSEAVGGPFRLDVLRAVAIAGEVVWTDDPALARAMRGIATFYAAEGDLRESSEWFEQAWRLRPPPRFERGFRAYLAFPDRKALALALDARGRWTYGFFTGEPTPEDAETRALAECRRRLPALGIEADCRIHAVDGTVVGEKAPRVRDFHVDSSATRPPGR